MEAVKETPKKFPGRTSVRIKSKPGLRNKQSMSQIPIAQIDSEINAETEKVKQAMLSTDYFVNSMKKVFALPEKPKKVMSPEGQEEHKKKKILIKKVRIFSTELNKMMVRILQRKNRQKRKRHS